MPRIRSIKPEMAKDEAFARLPRDARLLWIYMLPYADDEGRLRGHPMYLAAELFPYDEDVTSSRVEELLAQLEQAKGGRGFVRRYDVDGERFVEIQNFRTHQKINRPSPGKLPAPPPETLLTESSLSPQKDSVRDPDPDPDPDLRQTTTRARAKETPRERFHRDVIGAWRELAEPHLPTFDAQVIDFETENAITGFVLGQKLEPCTTAAIDLVRTLFERAAKSPLVRGEAGNKPYAKPMLWVLRNGSSVLGGKFDSTARAPPPTGPQPLRDTFSEKDLDMSRAKALNVEELPDDARAVVEKLSKQKAMGKS